MKHFFFAIASLVLTVPSALAQSQALLTLRPAKAAERQEAIKSIQAQLKAFARDDYKAAITYQSAGLKKNFASPDAFRTMMVRVYPEFAHFRSVQFGPAKSDPSGAHVAIPAAVTGQDGVTVRAFYFLVRENKIYRIEGVQGGAQAPADSMIGIPGGDI